jgi:hypothetical protein
MVLAGEGPGIGGQRTAGQIGNEKISQMVKWLMFYRVHPLDSGSIFAFYFAIPHTVESYNAKTNFRKSDEQ